MNEALRDWVANVHDTFYIIGTAAGPHPYPELVRDFQSRDRHAKRARRCSRPKAACPTCWSRRSAAARTRSACSIRSSTIPTSRCSASRRRATASTPAACRQPHRRRARRAARQQDLSAAGRGRPDHRGAFDLGRPRLSRHRPRAYLAARYRPGRIRSRSPTTRRSTRSSSAASSKASSPRSNRAHAIAAVARSARGRWTGDKIIVVNLSRPRRQGHLHRRRRAGGGDVSARSDAVSPHCSVDRCDRNRVARCHVARRRRSSR